VEDSSSEDSEEDDSDDEDEVVPAPTVTRNQVKYKKILKKEALLPE
jgi:hypothetical protein